MLNQINAIFNIPSNSIAYQLICWVSLSQKIKQSESNKVYVKTILCKRILNIYMYIFLDICSLILFFISGFIYAHAKSKIITPLIRYMCMRNKKERLYII